MRHEFSAGIVVYREHEGQRLYLLLHYASGHWDFAKGKIEKGETKQEAALRELKEEANISAKILPGFEFSFDYWFRGYETRELINKTVYFFVGPTQETDITLSKEHQGFAWLPYDTALEQLTYDNAKELLADAEAFLNK